MGIIKKIANIAVSVIIVINLGIFGFITWPENYSDIGIAHSGLPVVTQVVEDALLSGEIYQLDRERPVVQALIRLDIQLYAQETGRLITISPGWKTYVLTGDLAREVSHLSGAFAFTDPFHKVIVFLAIGGMNTMLCIAHEFTHVLQTEDNLRIMLIPPIQAEYEAEINSRLVIGLLADLGLPKTFPVHEISSLEKLEVLKYLAESGL